jgi:hypothetical protein
MRRCQFILLAGALALAAVAGADDGRGNYVIKGAGLTSCALYLEQREARSEAYFMMGGWVDGYLTAVNKHADDTFDVLSFEKTELVLNIMANHCESNPDDRLFVVLNSLLVKLQDDRIRSGSPAVEVAVGSRRAALYQETIHRVQDELTSRHLLRGEPSGRFDGPTVAALRVFQESIGFEATGFPDQLTLWRLFRPEDAG